MTASESHRCEAAGCMSTDVELVEYTDTFDGDRRKTCWACETHREVLSKRDSSAAGLRWIKATQALDGAFTALSNPSVRATRAADPHLKVLQEYLDSIEDIQRQMDATNDPEAKGTMAQLDHNVVSRVDRLLTDALRLRRTPSGDDDG